MHDGGITGKPFSLGVLFVHGIGAQTRGETLTSFGGPFCKWLDYRCAALAESQSIPGEVFARLQQKLEAADWTDEVLPGTVDRMSDDSPGTLHRAVLRETTFQDETDSAAPAHTKVALLSLAGSEEVSVENWLLAESCWQVRSRRLLSAISHAGVLVYCRGLSGAISRPRLNDASTNVLNFLRSRLRGARVPIMTSGPSPCGRGG